VGAERCGGDGQGAGDVQDHALRTAATTAAALPGSARGFAAMGRPDVAIESRRLAETIGNAVECPADLWLTLYGPKLRYLVNLRERDKPAQGKSNRQSSSNSIGFAHNPMFRRKQRCPDSRCIVLVRAVFNALGFS
jgi:hypothetical protein